MNFGQNGFIICGPDHLRRGYGGPIPSSTCRRGGASSAVGDIGSHWCDLADLSTVVATRFRTAKSPEAFATQKTVGTREAFTVQSEDLATILLRFEGGAKGSVNIGQVCAGHKNDLWLEMSGARGSLRWHQERQNELWLGQRHTASAVLAKDPALLAPAAAAYAHLPGGRQEGWADAFCNVMRDIYGFIRDAKRDAPRPPAFATFEDGLQSACVVEAILESHREDPLQHGPAVREVILSRPRRHEITKFSCTKNASCLRAFVATSFVTTAR